MNTSGTYRIRPAGRHLLTIGRDLIKDQYAAVVELVKNSYDADSPDVTLEFRAHADKSGYTLTVTDHGHGMSRDAVINRWLVPSTDDKLTRRTSPGGRIMQGRKGVGRFATSILGEDLLLETVVADGEKTTVFVTWKTFEAAQYLDDVEVLVESSHVDGQSGTTLTITGGRELLQEWDQDQFNQLRFELKKLLSPVSAAINSGSGDEFDINLTVGGFSEVPDTEGPVVPYPIFDLYDYRISGRIGEDGIGMLIYSVQKARNTADENISFSAGGPTGCGELAFDIRVYDRDSDSIDALIGRGLTNESGDYVGRLQAKQLLNQYNGIGVYRNGFRIRPLGDPDFDWLRLNAERVQNPSLRIGSNQAIGFVEIQAEELSGLIEKSARDGLRENTAFAQLKEITHSVIEKLEHRRFDYRRMVGLNKPVLKTASGIALVSSLDGIRKEIRGELSKSGVDKKTTDGIMDIISRAEEEKSKVADEIRQAVAVYQGQATLGKIIDVILHEGRQPLGCLKNEIPNLRYWYQAFQKTGDSENLGKLMPIAEGIGENTEVFVKLFSRLDPLAASKPDAQKALELRKIIEGSLSIFGEEMRVNNVRAVFIGKEECRLTCWYQDMYAIFTNLIDNSIYWMVEKNSQVREIRIEIAVYGDSLRYVDYRDTGPGIEPSLITSGAIFEPQFTTKPHGMGLGLAIAGEAASRNGLELKALESESGAYFRLQLKRGQDE